MVSFSVVVCTYTESRWSYLEAAIESLRRQYVQPLEVIIVVDHNPNLMHRVREHFPDIFVIENQAERGLSGARNSGIAASHGSVIAFLDDDAIAQSNWVEQLSLAYADPNVVGAGGMIEPLWHEGRPAWFPTEFDWVVGCTYRGMPEFVSPVRNLIGANMSFRRMIFDTVGVFRLAYGCDETDLCIRVRQSLPENILLYQPAAKVTHQVPASRASWDYFRSRCYFEGGSKAVVSWLVGAQDGLSSERAHTFRTLPVGIILGLKDALFNQRQDGLKRAGAILAGLAIAGMGYLVGRIFIKDAARLRGWQAG